MKFFDLDRDDIIEWIIDKRYSPDDEENLVVVNLLMKNGWR